LDPAIEPEVYTGRRPRPPPAGVNLPSRGGIQWV